jgi:type I restriction enzyme, S subunit
MIKYDKYKPSEIDFLKDIPFDWEVKRLKSLGDIRYGLGQPPKQLSNGLPIIRATNVSFGKITPKNMLFVDPDDLPYDRNPILKTNDIIVVRSGAYTGDSAIIPLEYNGAVTGYDMVYTPTYVNPKFISYSLLSDYVFKDQLVMSSLRAAQPHLNKEELGSALVFLPNKETQNFIADFLDNKCDAIDKKINLLTQKANYYKEYRKSLINETVCKGLDKNVKSKITELGFNVNENYSFFRLKDLGYLYSGLSGKAGEDFNQDENPNNKGFIPFTNIANNIYLKKDHLGTVVVYDNENQNKVKKEDVFFLMSSEGYEDIGKSSILDDDLNETYLNSFCKGYRVTNRKANPYFLNYLLLSDNYRKQLTVEGKGFTRINLKMEKVNDFIVFIPNTIDEQKKIVSFLDDKTQTIDKIVSNINTQIATLKELRKTLINDAVTGKIKVVS